MKLAFVILNYNDYKSTSELLQNIKDYKCLDLILVVDNCSTDDSFKRLKKYEKKNVKVIQSKANKGFASGLNFGAKYAIKELGTCHIILSNADIMIGSEENLKELHELMSQENLGVLAPVITQNNMISRGWRLPDMKTEILGNLPMIGQKLYRKRTSYQESHYTSRISYVDALSGCFFMVNANALEKIGFLDEHTFLYYEEYILAKRLQEAGYKIAVANDITVIHNHSVSIDKSLNRIKKFKALKKSQDYFCEAYLKASRFEMILLHTFKNMTLALLYIRSFLHLK